MNVNDYVIVDLIPVFWVSEKIFMSANQIGVLKLPTGLNLSLFFCFYSGYAVNKIPSCGVAMIANPWVCDVW